MKINLVLLATILLSGCGSTQLAKLADNSMLDVAPASDVQVRYPEWSEPAVSERPVNLVEGPQGLRKTDVAGSFSTYLQQLGIEHEILPGDHLIIKLRKKVLFTTGSSKVSNQSREWLSQIGSYISTLPDIDIVLEGHTDNQGTSNWNESLSEKRAEMVKQELMRQRVLPANIYTRGYGEYMPACNNATNPGQACNRRVELTFILANN